MNREVSSGFLSVRKFLSVLIHGALAAAGAGVAAESSIETAQLRLTVTHSTGYRFELRKQTPDAGLVRQTGTVFRIDSADRTVTGASGVQTGGDWLSANLTLSGGHTATVRFTFTAPDRLRVELTPTSGTSRTKVTEQFEEPPGRHYGVWESSKGRGGLVNNAGATGGLQDGQDVLTRAPFYFTSGNVGIYAPTTASYAFNFPATSGGTLSFSVDEAALAYYVMVGDSPKAVLAQFNQLAGPPFMPPDWAFGCLFWKDNPPLRPLDLAAQLQSMRIPASAFWLDRPWTSETTDGWGWGGRDVNNGINGFNSDRIEIAGLPAAQVTLQELASRFQSGYGMKLLGWTANLTGGYLSEQPDNLLLLPTNAGRPAFDVRKPESYAFFKGYLESFTQRGLAGYKIDRGDQGEYKTTDNVDHSNAVATLFQQLSYESLPGPAGGPKDGFVFARFAHDTGRRYTALWNSDAKPTETGFRMSMQHALRAGLIGFPMWGSDTGGYSLGSPGMSEALTARWLGLSAHGPFFETQADPGTNPDAAFARTFRAFATLHHELIPYNRSAMRQAIQTGVPVMRPLFLEFPDDPLLGDLWDEYFHGDSLLVAPITRVADTARDVYLPALPNGARWVEYNHPDRSHGGGQTVSVAADFANGVIPVFARDGAIVTRGDLVRSNNNWATDWHPWLRVECFPAPGVTRTFLYDTGTRSVEIVAGMADGTLTVAFGDLGVEGVVRVHLAGFSGNVSVNGVALPPAGFVRDPARSLLEVPFAGATTMVLTGVASLHAAAAADTDADGMADDWERAHFGAPDVPGGGWSADWDADGLCNRGEYIAGTNPTNGASFFALDIGVSNGQTTVLWAGLAAEGIGYSGFTRLYDLIECTNLAADIWTPVEGCTNLPGRGYPLRCALPMHAPRSFFRGSVRLVPEASP